MLDRHAGFTQGDGGYGRVPHGRLAGLQADGALIIGFDYQQFQFAQGALDVGGIVLMSETLQSDDAPDDRGEDGAQSVAFGKASLNPFGTEPDGSAAKRFDAIAFAKLDRQVGTFEELMPVNPRLLLQLIDVLRRGHGDGQFPRRLQE